MLIVGRLLLLNVFMVGYKKMDTISLQEFLNVIDEITKLPDEAINETTLKMLRDAIDLSIDEVGGKQAAIKSLAREIELNGATVEQYSENLHNYLDTLMQSLNITDSKRAYIQIIFDYMTELMDGALSLVKNDELTIYWQLCKENAKLPVYSTDGSAGMDVYIPEDITIPARSRGTIVPTGLKAAIPEGWMLSVRPRSGMSVKTPIRIANGPGTIDSDFRDEIGIIVDNIGSKPYEIHSGDRIAQFVLEKVYQAKNVISDTPVETIGKNRGGGFGSTGV